MGSVVSFWGGRLSPSWRRAAAGYIGLSAVGLVASLVLAWLPLLGAQIVTPVPSLPLVTGFVGLSAGGLCLALARGGAPSSAPGSMEAGSGAASFSGLQSVVQQLCGALAEERDKAVSFQEVFSAAMREVRVVSTRVARLTEAALDAETRLAAGVAEADGALRLPAVLAAQPMDDMQPAKDPLLDIGDLIRNGFAEQSQAISVGLEATMGRLVLDTEGPMQTFRAAVNEAAGHIKVLGDTAVLLRRDVTALDTASRETALANAKVVARISGAIAQIDEAVAGLPAAAASVTAAVEQATVTLAEASGELRADSAALEASRNDTLQAASSIQLAAEALNASVQGIDDAGATARLQVGDVIAEVNAAIAGMPAAAAMMTAAVEDAARSLTEASAELRADGTAMQVCRNDTEQVSAAIKLVAETLTVRTQELEGLSAKAMSQLSDTIADVKSVVSELPVAAANVTAAAQHGAQRIEEVSAALCADAAALAKCSRDTQQSAAEGLAATGLALSETGHQTIAMVAKAAELALSQLAAVIVDSEGDRESLTSFAKRTTTLENVAATLVENAYRLDEAGQRSAAAGEWIAGRLDMSAARSEALMQALPDVAAGITNAAAGLLHETSVLTAAAQQIAVAGDAATSALSDVAAMAASSAVSVDAAGRVMNAANGAMDAQIERLAEAARQAETHAALLPDVAGSLTAAAGQLQATAEAWRAEQTHSVLRGVTARMEVAASSLDRLDAMSSRLENVVAGLPAEQAQEATLSALSGLSADIAVSVRRVEAALTGHDVVWPSVAASIADVQAAAHAVAQAAAERVSQGPGRASFLPDGLDAETAPAAVVATLRHFDEVACQSEMLLEQAEALAEAVLAGRAPGLPPLVAERTPGLLAEIDATTKRLRSVATALALASDGVPGAERRRA